LIHYPIPPHLQEAYQYLGYKKGDFPIAEEIADSCLSLPIYPGITEKEIEFVTEKIKIFFNK
ncbi:MAG: DegT/DnrJ/EryC1/StrS family aminotransferase, partial [Chitinophagaceae bacterium]|nr:DegT/DnrJ/EryC1/StrS family aminotransferase [Chitinophagaceae bacterium]